MSQINPKSLKVISVFLLLPVLLILGESKSAYAQSLINNREAEIHLSSDVNFQPPSDEQPRGETGDGGGR